MLSGGGARAAYQVGFLRVLARECPGVVPGILTGVSAGGINAAYLAAREEPFARRIDDLADVWAGIRIDNVFRVDLRDLASFPSGDATALREKLERLLALTPAERDRISAAARSAAEERWSWASVAERLLAVAR